MKTAIKQFFIQMKYGSVFLLTIAAATQGCNDPQELAAPTVTNEQSAGFPVESLKAFLASETGTSPKEVQYDSTSEEFIIHNEIIVSKKDAANRLNVSKTAQRRGPFLLRDDVARQIKIDIVPDHTSEWRIALSEAVKEWNALGGKIQFKIVTTGSHITMDFSRKANGDITWSVREPMPTYEGYFDKNLTTNPSANYLTANQKKGALVHALGHMIGLSHTGTTNEWVPSQINGTNRLDPKSVMQPYYMNWEGFTIDDQRAADYLYPSSGWKQLPGEARDVAAAYGGKLWAIGNTPVSGGYSVHYYDVTYKVWKQVPGGGVRIAAGGPEKAPWIVNNEGKIFKRLESGAWQPYPGQATDIGVGKGGEAWIIGKTPVSGGYTIYKWENGSWALKPGGAVRITVLPGGDAMIVNNVGQIFIFNGHHFVQIPGLAYDIASGPDSYYYIIGRTPMPSGGYSIHRWQGNLWTQLPGGGTNITAFEEPRGPVVTNNLLKISQWDL
nr:hypothetical protein [uncultured Dyadobacter sp.]